MGRKKRKNVKPWCWYCNREFDDEKVLIGHQKAKHFKCHICHKKLYTAPGLAIHCSQVHKETITKVPNALLERSILDFEIYGMEGVPEEAKRMRELEKHGTVSDSDGPDTKRPKVDAPSSSSEGLFPAAGMVPPFPPVLMPGMPPMLPGIVPPPGMMPPMMPPATSGVGPQPVPFTQPPQRPLFPSAAQPIASSQTHVKEGDSSATNATVLPSRNAPLVVPLSENSLLMHPKEDLSMEEIRAQRKQYSSGVLPPVPPSSLPGPPILRPGMSPGAVMNITSGPMPVIRPGMGPPDMGIRPPMV